MSDKKKKRRKIISKIGIWLCYGIIVGWIIAWLFYDLPFYSILGLPIILFIPGLMWGKDLFETNRERLKDEHNIDIRDLIPIGKYMYGDAGNHYLLENEIILIVPKDGKLSICYMNTKTTGAYEFLKDIDYSMLTNIYFQDTRNSGVVFDGYESYRGVFNERRTRTYPVYKKVSRGNIKFYIKWKENGEERKLVTLIRDDGEKQFVKEHFLDKYVKIEYV